MAGSDSYGLIHSSWHQARGLADHCCRSAIFISHLIAVARQPNNVSPVVRLNVSLWTPGDNMSDDVVVGLNVPSLDILFVYKSIVLCTSFRIWLELLESHGWIRREYENEAPASFCLVWVSHF